MSSYTLCEMGPSWCIAKYFTACQSISLPVPGPNILDNLAQLQTVVYFYDRAPDVLHVPTETTQSKI